MLLSERSRQLQPSCVNIVRVGVSAGESADSNHTNNLTPSTMQLDRAIKFTNRLLIDTRQRELSELELAAFEGIWLDISYQQSSQNSNYEMVTIKNTASRLLQDLSEAVGERVSKKNCRSILLRLANTNEERVDLADAPTDIQPFCGRDAELAKLIDWLTIDRCKLVGILGIGGIGKTALAARLSDRDLTADFDLVIWRSLREAPPLQQLLGELVQFLSEFTEIEVPNSNDRAISRLLYHLRQKRCLIVLDNLEAIMEAGDYAGKYRSTHTDYGQLFQKIGTTRHQSCLAIDREPISLASLETHLQPLGYAGNIVQTIDSLQQRSLIEVTQGQRYTLQNVVMEFMTGATIRELATEIGKDGGGFFLTV